MAIWEKLFSKITFKDYPDTSTPLNADNLNKMTDAIDGIDDRVVELNSNLISGYYSGDMNNLTTTGRYWCTNCTNMPLGVSWGVCEVITPVTSGELLQIIYDNNNIFTRIFANNQWYDWASHLNNNTIIIDDNYGGLNCGNNLTYAQKEKMLNVNVCFEGPINSNALLSDISKIVKPSTIRQIFGYGKGADNNWYVTAFTIHPDGTIKLVHQVDVPLYNIIINGSAYLG